MRVRGESAVGIERCHPGDWSVRSTFSAPSRFNGLGGVAYLSAALLIYEIDVFRSD